MKLFTFIIAVVLVDFFCSSEAWIFGRRRRRRCTTPSTKHGGWYNHLKQPFTFTCPEGQAMTEIHSNYSSCHSDRVFRFACRRNMAAKGRCHWSHYVNNFDKPVSYKCPYSGFLTGISSYHHNSNKDRRFKFRCCHRHHYHPYHCTTGSHFLNQWRKPINFSAPRKHFLVGVTSYHDKGQKDRRWKFEYCKVFKICSSRRKAKKN